MSKPTAGSAPAYSAREVVEILQAARSLAQAVSECMRLSGYEPRREERQELSEREDDSLGSCDTCAEPKTMGRYGKPYCHPCWRKEKDKEKGLKQKEANYKKNGRWD